MKPTGISAAEAHQDVTSGKALLVCAYRDEEACREVQLEGSIPLARFESKHPGLPKDQEIIFYCA
jgi:rhodanese-related sulfurtransferase